VYNSGVACLQWDYCFRSTEISLTITIDLPDDLAKQFVALSEEERRAFSTAAIADAPVFRGEEGDVTTVVEQALNDMDAGNGLRSFEDVCQQWDTERASRMNHENT